MDVHVGKHLTECLLGKQGILADKTRLMVTHNQGVMDIADMVEYMEDGILFKNSIHKEEWDQDTDEKEVCKEKTVNSKCCNGVLSEQLEKKFTGDQTKKIEGENNTKIEDDKSKTMQDKLVKKIN